MGIRPIALAATLALVAALAAASPASAGAENGATVFNESECFDWWLGTTCYDVKGVAKTTQTPSGGESTIINSRGSYEFTSFDGCRSSSSESSHSHVLLKDGTLHELGGLSGSESTFQCSGFDVTCTYRLHQHYANGQVQVFRPEFECTTL